MAKPIHELEQDRAYYIRSAEELTKKAEKEERALTDEETAQFDAFIASAASTAAQIESLEATRQRAEKIAKVSEQLRKPAAKVVPTSVSAGEPADLRNLPATAKRYSALKAFKGPDAEYNAYASGQWLRATILGDGNAKQWCIGAGIGFRNALNEGTQTQGGFLVPEQFAQTIIDLRETYGVFRANCDVFPMSSESTVIPRRASGNTAYWVGEGATITESTMGFNQVRLTTRKLACLTRMSTEVAEDAIINLADYVANDFAYQFAYQEDLAGFLGDGTSTYGGITGLFTQIIDGTHTASAIDAVSGEDTLAEVTTTSLTKAMGALPQYALPNAKWFCSQYAATVVFGRLQAAAGGNNMQTLQGAFGNSFLGYPIVVSQVLTASTGTINGTYMLGFGDLRAAATLGDRRGIAVGQSSDVYFTTDQIALRAAERVDINVHDLGTTSAAGPFIALLGKT